MASDFEFIPMLHAAHFGNKMWSSIDLDSLRQNIQEKQKSGAFWALRKCYHLMSKITK